MSIHPSASCPTCNRSETSTTQPFYKHKSHKAHHIHTSHDVPLSIVGSGLRNQDPDSSMSHTGAAHPLQFHTRTPLPSTRIHCLYASETREVHYTLIYYTVPDPLSFQTRPSPMIAAPINPGSTSHTDQPNGSTHHESTASAPTCLAPGNQPTHKRTLPPSTYGRRRHIPNTRVWHSQLSPAHHLIKMRQTPFPAIPPHAALPACHDPATTLPPYPLRRPILQPPYQYPALSPCCPTSLPYPATLPPPFRPAPPEDFFLPLGRALPVCVGAAAAAAAGADAGACR